MTRTSTKYHLFIALLLVVSQGAHTAFSAQLKMDDLLDIVLEREFLGKEDTTTTQSVFNQGNCPGSQVGKIQNGWYLQRLNRSQSLDSYVVPEDLVEISPHISTKNNGSICLEKTTAEELYLMTQDAKKLGLDITVLSGYRSYSDQQYLYDLYAPEYNAQAYFRVAHPGHSEHHLGTTFDLAGLSAGYHAGSAFARSPEGIWLKKNGHRYGFIMSYPEGKEQSTGYQSEPWHWRYVGSKNARLLTILEYTLAFEKSQSTYFTFPTSSYTGEIGG